MGGRPDCKGAGILGGVEVDAADTAAGTGTAAGIGTAAGTGTAGNGGIEEGACPVARKGAAQTSQCMARVAFSKVHVPQVQGTSAGGETAGAEGWPGAEGRDVMHASHVVAPGSFSKVQTGQDQRLGRGAAGWIVGCAAGIKKGLPRLAGFNNTFSSPIWAVYRPPGAHPMITQRRPFNSILLNKPATVAMVPGISAVRSGSKSWTMSLAELEACDAITAGT